MLDSGAAARLRSSTGSLAALAILLVVFAFTPDTGFVIGLATAPLLLALTGENAVSRAFGSRIVHFLGEISYSVYLGHFLFSSIAYRLVNVQWMQTGAVQLVLGLAGITAFVLAMSTITYYAIERPGRNLLRNFSGAR